MTLSGEFMKRRAANAKSLAAFGVTNLTTDNNRSAGTEWCETIREGHGPTIYTIGYEKRDAEDLISCLVNAGIDCLVDVRERPMSRKPDFRKNVLAQHCSDAGIDYESWQALGSTAHQREQLKETGNISEFMRRFKSFAKRGRSDEINDLAQTTHKRSIALLCYERCHHECHRSIVAELLANEVDASIVAIL